MYDFEHTHFFLHSHRNKMFISGVYIIHSHAFPLILYLWMLLGWVDCYIILYPFEAVGCATLLLPLTLQY